MLGTGQREKANFTPKEQALLDYVRVLTLTPANTKDADVEKCRKAGWTDPEIFEASFITALFAFFNRMADAYGLDYSANYWLPPDQRKSDYKPMGGSPNPTGSSSTNPRSGSPK